MQKGLLVTGIAAIVVIAGAWYAFNRDAVVVENPDIVSSVIEEDMALTLSSNAFAHGESIPSKFTCDENRNLNPQLSFGSVPEGAQSLVLIMDDPDIPEQFKVQRGIDAYDHWTLFNIPADTTEIPEGGTVGTTGANGSGVSAYTGPCPPKEYEPTEHAYSFRLYALDTMLDLPAGSNKKTVQAAMAGHVLEETELVGKYERK